MTETIERIARTVLWVVLSITIVVVPIGIAKRHSEVDAVRTEMKAALQKAEDRISELSKPKAPEEFDFKGIIYLAGLSYTTATGGMTFTNTTAKGGFLCLKGVARDAKTETTADSIPTCKEIKPYDSNVHLEFRFGAGDLRKACPQETGCSFSIGRL